MIDRITPQSFEWQGQLSEIESLIKDAEGVGLLHLAEVERLTAAIATKRAAYRGDHVSSNRKIEPGQSG
jgi:hypothetical protein